MNEVRTHRLAHLLRTVLWHRRLLAAGLAAGSVALVLQAAEPRPPDTTAVVVAAYDLVGGAPLAAADLAIAYMLPDTVPAGSVQTVEAAAGRMLGAPMRAGEPVTDVRLVGPALAQAWGADLVAVPVRVADPGVAAIARPGDLIDLLGVPMDGMTAARTVAAQVPLLALPAAQETGAFTDGALLIVAVTDDQAAALAQAAVTSRLSVAIR